MTEFRGYSAAIACIILRWCEKFETEDSNIELMPAEADEGCTDEMFMIALCIPDWCQTYQIKVIEDAVTIEKDGYLYIKKSW